MTTVAWTALAVAGACAITDWTAVAHGRKALEYVFKPATIVALIVVATSLHPHVDAQRWAFVVALVFSLAGDVFLMLPRDLFVPGLASFFVAHVAFIVGLRFGEHTIPPVLVGLIIVGIAVGLVSRRILPAVQKRDPELRVPVTAYITVITLMGACALATRRPLAATGAASFMASDTLIAWNRFVQRMPWAPLVIIVTYHLAQALLVLSLGL